MRSSLYGLHFRLIQVPRPDMYLISSWQVCLLSQTHPFLRVNQHLCPDEMAIRSLDETFWRICENLKIGTAMQWNAWIILQSRCVTHVSKWRFVRSGNGQGCLYRCTSSDLKEHFFSLDQGGCRANKGGGCKRNTKDPLLRLMRA